MGELHDTIRRDLENWLTRDAEKFPADERLAMDMHCHDHGSAEPDELLGRMLGVPETWLASEDLIATLERHGCDAFTITNHNNARSCFDLIDKGYDILPAAEYSCMVPKFGTGIHVLAYGLSPEDDGRLRKIRSDIMKFLDYTSSHNIPTVCAHPLYHYKSKGIPPMEFFDLLLVLFERFEAVNGQRDSWQNLLVKAWLDAADRDTVDRAAKLHGVNPFTFCADPYRKVLTGGSDEHMGIFAGLTGSYLHVPDLAERLKTEKRSTLALEAIRRGNIVPFGTHNDSEKMTIAFIDYFCQIAMNMEDPGLLRILLHKGDVKDKVISLVLSNVFGEMRRHRNTMGFLRVFHEAFTGRSPSLRERFLIKKEYQPAIAEIVTMANTWKSDPDKAAGQFRDSLESIFGTLTSLAAKRAHKRLSKGKTSEKLKEMKADDIISMIEIPSRFRSLSEAGKKRGEFPMSSFSASELFDDLSFPLLGSGVILAANFTGAKVMYNARPLVRAMASKLGKYAETERVLWLTDTFEDANGVATVLREMHREVKKRNLPIDFLVCSDTLGADRNLIVTKPVSTFTLPFYQQQPVRIPNMMELQRIFHEGEYNRIVCSTEGFMGMAALYLKHAFTVPAHFYLHTDWMTFAQTVLGLDHHARSRLRRILRAFYRQFDSLFVLNKDQRAWLTSSKMGFAPERVHLTAHWVEDEFRPGPDRRKELFGIDKNRKVVLFAGRVSEEKGVMELPLIMNELRKKDPSIALVVAGKGPMEEKLRDAIPYAVFLGWVPHNKLPEIYSSADILVLPSQFDTFGCVILEALACGLPAVSYETKGPKDIIEHGKSGFLFTGRDEMTDAIGAYLENASIHPTMRENACLRAGLFSADKIIADLMRDLGFGD